VLQTTDAHWHDYGKQSRPGRKVGHATVCAADPAKLVERVDHIARALGRGEQAAPVLGALT
jgi:5-(carboxyamino)imidazole ribonucleotide synthase